jgi:outer membrane protein OmpA-like peptidoglycan-associated protein
MHTIFRLFCLWASFSFLSACSQQATVPVSAPTVDNEIRQVFVKTEQMKSKQIERGVLLSLSDSSLFENETANFADNADGFLDKITNLLKQYPGRNAVIEVHTDNTGGERFNLKMSQKRAEQLRAALIQRGISPKRIIAKGYGETQPIATNHSEVGRLQNRRVEVTVLREGEVLRF